MQISIYSSRIKMNDGFYIPQIGLGTYTIDSQQLSDELIPYSFELGYHHYDTAKMYDNEFVLGNTIKKYKIPREEVFITSKILPQHMTYQKAIDETKLTLRDLKTDYLDMLLLHWPGEKRNRLEAWRACEYLKNEGLVKSIGVSNFKVRHLESLKEKSDYLPCVNQIEIHPLYYDEETIDYCRKKNIIMEAYSPFAVNDHKLIQNSYLKELSKKYGKSIYQVILKWDLMNDFVVLPRSKDKRHLKANLEVADFELTKEELTNITQLNCNYKTDWDPESIKI